MKIEKYNWGNVYVFPEDEDAHTDEIRCLDAADIQGHVDEILKRHSDWFVCRLAFKYDGGELKGKIYLTAPLKKGKNKKRKLYHVSWREHSVNETTVLAKNKREARKLAEETAWPENREYEPPTDWEIKEVADEDD